MASVEFKMKKLQWKAQALKQMQTEGSLKNTGIKTGVETLLSVLIGGAIGSYVGRPSFVAGLAATASGHYFGINWLSPIGIGMMAASNPMSVNSVSGFDHKGGKERLIHFKDSLLHKTYLDKVFKKGNNENGDSTYGIGELEAQTQSLNEIEKQLVQSALEFQRQRGESTAGLEDDFQGIHHRHASEPDFSRM